MNMGEDDKLPICLIFPDGGPGKANALRKRLRRLSTRTPATLLVLQCLTPPDYSVTVMDERTRDIDYNFRGLVAITSMTFNVNRAYEIADRFRAAGQKVVMGGIHVSFCREEALRHCDSVVAGEAESVWATVLEDYRNGRLKPIYEGERILNFAQVLSDNLDRVEPRDLHMNIQTSRGCNFQCKFCSVHAYIGPARNLNDSTVMKLLSRITFPYNRHVVFIDDNIYADPRHFKRLFRLVARSNIRWHALCSLNIAKDDEALSILKASGCKTLGIGLESTNKATLREIGKPNDPGKYLDLISKLHTTGIGITGFFIVGADSDTKDSILETIAFCRKVNIAWPAFLIYTPLPGTEVFEKLRGENRIATYDWSQYDLGHVVFQPRNFSGNELKEMFDLCNRSLHGKKALLHFLFQSLAERRFQNIVPIIARFFTYSFSEKTPPHSAYSALISRAPPSHNNTVDSSRKVPT